MKIVDIAYTVIPVSNLKASRDFYEKVVGLKPSSIFEKDGMGMIEYDVGTTTIAIGAGAPFFSVTREGGAVAFEVTDFPDAVSHLKAAGAEFVLEGYESPVCLMAIFRDPDGNKLMLHQKKGHHA